MISKKKAWLIILCSVLIVSGMAFAIQTTYKKQLRDPKFQIVALAQSSTSGELLKTNYLAELLGLSIDRPSHLLRFNTALAERKLKANPLIKEAHIAKIKPGTLSIEYQLRIPIAFLADYSNTVLDSEGRLFPFHPFFTPKKLPEIVLGPAAFEGVEPRHLWGQKLTGTRFEMALNLHTHLTTLFQGESVSIQRIDVSKAYALSYGQRQVVVILEERFTRDAGGGRTLLIAQTRLLRLGSANWLQGLNRYLVLRAYLAKEEAKQPIPEANVVQKEPLTIDLRVPRQALFY